MLAMLLSICGMAQQRNISLTVEVVSIEGDDISGQDVSLEHTEYDLNYGNFTLDKDGKHTLNVYAGPHKMTIVRNGFNTVEHAFTVTETPTDQSVKITLTEKTRDPFALKAELSHDAFSGHDDVVLSWNIEEPAFFDDFESYEPFSLEFGEWTGIDGDREAAAPLVGTYPNRGVMQYAQIINPLSVTPTWWYDYPVLRPYSGQQYVGFTRTSSGNANDDWLISPVITPGTDNVLSFMGKAADIYTERFMVFVTEKTDNPGIDDFVRIDTDNYETADYSSWKEYIYDLSEYSGKPIRFAIRYISDSKRFGAFMLMVDDVYVGPDEPTSAAKAAKARRAGHRSPANRFEKFDILLDGQKIGETEDYEYVITDIQAGTHTIGIQARYLQAISNVTNIDVTIDKDNVAEVNFILSADSKANVDTQKLQVLSLENGVSYSLDVKDGKASIPYLPYGKYEIHVAEGTFTAYSHTLDVNTSKIDHTVALTDNVIAPYNLVINNDEKGNTVIKWNQKLLFTDSFETYDDFATGEFGDWKTYDVDKNPVYPIGLGSTSNIVSFPGSGDATNPRAIGPMVFNPWKTNPAMLPTDEAIQAPTGDKTVIFFSAQRGLSDKWLVSPEIEINNDYKLTVKAKAYTSMYTESLEFGVAEEGDHPEDFTIIAQVPSLISTAWGEYSVDLDEYAGKTVRIAIRYTAFDAFLTQIDDFTVGPKSGEGEVIDYGNILHYEIYLDKEKAGQTEEPSFTFTDLTPGSHTIGVRAVYKNGYSELTEQTFVVSGIESITSTPESMTETYYDLHGRRLNNAPESGMYIIKQNGKYKKSIR